MESYWEPVTEEVIASTSLILQGDFLPECHVPIPPDEFDEEAEFNVEVWNAVVITQSCDLVNKPPELVALCPIHTLKAFEEANPQNGKSKGLWNEVRSMRREGLHLLSPHEDVGDVWNSWVVDFRHIISLPHDYLAKKFENPDGRWRLKSPYLEHFSQAFARFFMRVGLPSQLPKFTGNAPWKS